VVQNGRKHNTIIIIYNTSVFCLKTFAGYVKDAFIGVSPALLVGGLK